MKDGVVVLDKPAGITSFRAVERVARILGAKKCGHAGTLDPLATGVLPVCVGRATKIAGYLSSQEKEYEVTFRAGAATDTGDLAGRVVREVPGAATDEAAVTAATARLVGTFEQVPPAHSAVKVQGVRSYVLARQGRSVPLAARSVTVREARVRAWAPAEFSLFLRCSKGFYVRALSESLGGELGVPLAVAALRRVASGPFRIAEAVTLERLEEAQRRGESDGLIVSIEASLAGFARLEIPAEGAEAVRRGRSPAPWLSGQAGAAGEGVALLTESGRGPVALVERVGSGEWRIVRGI